MKISYFKQTDTLYIELNASPSAISSEVSEGVVIDYDIDNKPIGIEIENASRSFDLASLSTNNIPLKIS